MGLFFSKARVKKSTNSGKVSAGTLNKLQCKVCSLDKKAVTFVKEIPEGPVNTDFYILSGTPDNRDQSEETKILKKSFGAAKHKSLRYNYCVRCLDKGLHEPKWNEIECCRKFIENDIEKTKPKAIFGMGKVPLNWFIGTQDITKWRGRRIPVTIGTHTCWFYPIVDISYVVSNRKKFKGSDKVYESAWDRVVVSDIKKALKTYKEDPKVEEKKDYYKGIIIVDSSGGDRDIRRIKKFFDLLSNESSLGLDIETNKLRPYSKPAKILTVSIGTYENTIAFPLDHKKAKWTKKQRSEVGFIFLRFLKNSSKKFAHNLPFEMEWLYHFLGSDITDVCDWGCTQAQAYIIDEKKGMLKLDTLCLQYFGFNLKTLNTLDIKDLDNEDLTDVLNYNALDAKYTHKLSRVQEKLLVGVLADVYISQIRRVKTIVLTQAEGLYINKKTVARFSKKLGKKQKKIIEGIRALPIVKKYENIKGPLLLSSPQQVEVLLRDFIKAKEGIRGDKYSTDEKVLKSIDHPFCKKLLELRNVSKLKSTYIDSLVEGNLVYEDGMIHTTLNSTLTATGRLSSDNPNIQNFPNRKDKWIRKVIEAREGYSLVSADYGQIEARVIGMASKDKNFCKALRENYDIHMEWAEKIAFAYPSVVGGKGFLKDASKMKEFRGSVKNSWVFPLFFGSSVYSVAQSLKLPENKAKALYEEFWTTFEGVREWQKEIESFYNKHGYVETLTGRRRHAPLSYNKMINAPIQGTASDIVVDAMDRLSEKGKQAVMNVHDDLTFYIKNDVLDGEILFIAEEMCRADFDFINVPLSIEVAVGSNWYNQKPVGVWSSLDFK